MTTFEHVTVLLRETVEGIAPRAGGRYADVTLGGGGHARAVLEASAPDGRMLAIDRDPAALAAARERLGEFGDRVTFRHSSFAELSAMAREEGFERLDGLVADLGVSSPQLDVPERGFSFSSPGPLDMRMDPTRGEPLQELLERVDADELADILFQLGGERRSRAIARSIKHALERGDLHTTEDLRRAVVRILGPRKKGIDPATRTFQALRIAVNEELDALAELLRVAPDLLVDGGRLAIISFHSGEDRMVKHAFRGDARLTPLTKKPVSPAEDELAVNPRSRSAKLRVAERVARGGEA